MADIQVQMTSPAGVTLATKGTYCPEDVTISPVLQQKTATPSTTQQTISPDSGYAGLLSVSVGAMPSGSVSNPVATKGSVSNNQITVTPSVSTTAGYVAGGNKTGAAVTVAASELVSGTLSITDNGEKTVTNYQKVNVNVQPPLQSKSVTPNESSQTVSPSTNYYGLSSVTVGAISSTYVGSGVARKAAATITPSESQQTIAANQYLTGTQTIGAISSTYVGSGVTKKSAATITPGTTDQTIAAGQYLNGAQTIRGDSNLVASNIISGKTIFGVAGSVQFQRYYTGSSTPSSSLGSNGDIYFMG